TTIGGQNGARAVRSVYRLDIRTRRSNDELTSLHRIVHLTMFSMVIDSVYPKYLFRKENKGIKALKVDEIIMKQLKAKDTK
ncbi:hypothetical protein SFRURICE_016130, partial [Spodoptera frugiperda]